MTPDDPNNNNNNNNSNTRNLQQQRHLVSNLLDNVAFFHSEYPRVVTEHHLATFRSIFHSLQHHLDSISQDSRRRELFLSAIDNVEKLLLHLETRGSNGYPFDLEKYLKEFVDVFQVLGGVEQEMESNHQDSRFDSVATESVIQQMNLCCFCIRMYWIALAITSTVPSESSQSPQRETISQKQVIGVRKHLQSSVKLPLYEHFSHNISALNDGILDWCGNETPDLTVYTYGNILRTHLEKLRSACEELFLRDNRPRSSHHNGTASSPYSATNNNLQRHRTDNNVSSIKKRKRSEPSGYSSSSTTRDGQPNPHKRRRNPSSPHSFQKHPTSSKFRVLREEHRLDDSTSSHFRFNGSASRINGETNLHGPSYPPAPYRDQQRSPPPPERESSTRTPSVDSPKASKKRQTSHLNYMLALCQADSATVTVNRLAWTLPPKTHALCMESNYFSDLLSAKLSTAGRTLLLMDHRLRLLCCFFNQPIYPNSEDLVNNPPVTSSFHVVSVDLQHNDDNDESPSMLPSIHRHGDVNNAPEIPFTSSIKAPPPSLFSMTESFQIFFSCIPLSQFHTMKENPLYHIGKFSFVSRDRIQLNSQSLLRLTEADEYIVDLFPDLAADDPNTACCMITNYGRVYNVQALKDANISINMTQHLAAKPTNSTSADRFIVRVAHCYNDALQRVLLCALLDDGTVVLYERSGYNVKQPVKQSNLFKYRDITLDTGGKTRSIEICGRGTFVAVLTSHTLQFWILNSLRKVDFHLPEGSELQDFCVVKQNGFSVIFALACRYHPSSSKSDPAEVANIEGRVYFVELLIDSFTAHLVTDLKVSEGGDYPVRVIRQSSYEEIRMQYEKNGRSLDVNFPKHDSIALAISKKGKSILVSVETGE